MKTDRSTFRDDAIGLLWRNCRKVLPDGPARSAALFLVSYIAMVVAFGALMSALAGMATEA